MWHKNIFRRHLYFKFCAQVNEQITIKKGLFFKFISNIETEQQTAIKFLKLLSYQIFTNKI